MKTLKSILSAVLGICTLIGGLAVVMPDLRHWFQTNALIAWLLSLVLVLVVALLVSTLDRVKTARTTAAGELKAANHKLEQAQAALHATSRDLSTTANELETIRRELMDAQSKVSGPSEHDRTQAREILEHLPWGTGTLVWLTGSSMKQWDDEQSKVLYKLDRTWEEWFFDAPGLQTVFVDLRAALSQLLTWMGGYGFAMTTSSELKSLNRTKEDPTLYRLASGAELDGGWESFDAIREEGLRLADNFVARRRDFEHAARTARV